MLKLRTFNKFSVYIVLWKFKMIILSINIKWQKLKQNSYFKFKGFSMDFHFHLHTLVMGNLDFKDCSYFLLNNGFLLTLVKENLDFKDCSHLLLNNWFLLTLVMENLDFKDCNYLLLNNWFLLTLVMENLDFHDCSYLPLKNCFNCSNNSCFLRYYYFNNM